MTKEIHDINTRALDFVVELIEYIAEYPDDDYMTMECLCRKLFKYGLIDKKDGYYLVADGIKADRKTENSSEKPNNSTISKMEQVDKDINVRSKDEPQTDCCDTCIHKDDGWDCESCDSCSKANSNYEPVDDLIRQADEMIKFDNELLQMSEEQSERSSE
jgi:hypothetical protein